MRVIFGCVVAVLVAALGGLIMGEYFLSGAMALLAGALFGLAVGESAIAVGKSSEWVLVGVAAVAAFLGFTWSGWIEAGRSFDIDVVRWIGSLCALASAAWWVRAFGSRPLRNWLDEEPEAETAPE
jgi:hypothetical protein